MNPSFGPEGRRIGWLLTEIERQTKGRLSEEEQDNLLNEVVAHLDASIQGRLDAGLSPTEAERQAVEDFGPPQASVRELLQVHERASGRQPPKSVFRGDPWVMLTFWIATSVALVTLDAGLELVTVRIFLAELTLFTVAFGTFSYRSRTMRPMPILLAAIVMAPIGALAFSLTWVNVWNYGGAGEMPRRMAADLVKNRESNIGVLERGIQRLEQGISLHSAYPTPADMQHLPSAERGLWMTFASYAPDFKNLRWPPTRTRWTNETGCIVLKPTDDAARAAKEWKSAAPEMIREIRSVREELSTEAAADKAALAAPPLSNFRSFLDEILPAAVIWALAAIVLNGVFGGLGQLLATYPRLGRRRMVA